MIHTRVKISAIIISKDLRVMRTFVSSAPADPWNDANVVSLDQSVVCDQLSTEATRERANDHGKGYSKRKKKKKKHYIFARNMFATHLLKHILRKKKRFYILNVIIIAGVFCEIPSMQGEKSGKRSCGSE